MSISERLRDRAESAVSELRASLDEESPIAAQNSPLTRWEKEKARWLDLARQIAPWAIRCIMLLMLLIIICELWYLISIVQPWLPETALPTDLAIRQLGSDLPSLPTPPPLP